MANLRLPHGAILLILTICTIITLGVSAALVGDYNDTGYPSSTATGGVRLALVASIWTVPSTVFFLLGLCFFSRQLKLVGLFPHLLVYPLAFILYLAAGATVQNVISSHRCDDASVANGHCELLRGLGVMCWLNTVILFILNVTLAVLAVLAHRKIEGIRGAFVSETKYAEDQFFA